MKHKLFQEITNFMKAKKIIITACLIILNLMKIDAKEKDTLSINQIYQSPETHLLTERIISFDSLNRGHIMNKFENWCATNFRDYEKVRTSKTENQIVLNYISKFYYYKSNEMNLYIILIAEFKDNKIRLRFYDDGNTFIPAVYSGNTLISPSTPSRQFKLSSYFDKNGLFIYNPIQGNFNLRQRIAKSMIDLKSRIDIDINDIEKEITKKDNTINSEW